jgi:hypothetical protein
MLPLWPAYYSEAPALVFVVDAADAGALAAAAVELFEALEHKDLEVMSNRQRAGGRLPATRCLILHADLPQLVANEDEII